MADTITPSLTDVIDPEVKIFVDDISQGYSQFPSFDDMTPDECRAVAEKVRAPWRVGGPEMASTRELQVPFEGRGVRIRVYDPGLGESKNRAALIYLHGGGFTFFSLDTHDRVMREYAGRAGVVVIGVDYSLSPEAKFPVALNEIVAVTRWLRANAEQFGVDPDRLTIGGDSAGGNLSMATCLVLRDAGEGNAIRGMLLNYAGFVGDCSEEIGRKYGGPGFMLGRDEIHALWDNYLASRDDITNPLAAPMEAKLEGLPPVFLVVAECDVLAEQNVEMHEKLIAAGVSSKLEIYKGATHSFLEAVSVSKVAARALQDSAEWLNAVTVPRV
jgi:acetyl esterase